jgi:hypothetical protein
MNRSGLGTSGDTRRTYNEPNGAQTFEPDEEYSCDSQWTAFLWEDVQGNACFAPRLRKKLRFCANLRGENYPSKPALP